LKLRSIACWAIAALALAASTARGQGTKAMTFEDLMKFRAIQRPVISDNGAVVAFEALPGRGDGEGVVHQLATGQIYRVPRGSAPAVSADGRFAAMAVKPPFEATEKGGRDQPKPGMALLDTTTGAVVSVDNVS